MGADLRFAADGQNPQKQCLESLGVQGRVRHAEHIRQNLPFARQIGDRKAPAVFDASDFYGQADAFLKKPDDFTVYFLNLTPKHIQIFLHAASKIKKPTLSKVGRIFALWVMRRLKSTSAGRRRIAVIGSVLHFPTPFRHVECHPFLSFSKLKISGLKVKRYNFA
jgi:hypothetical protein